MNYKPFNLEAAKAGKPIICRDGEPARFIAHEPNASPHSRVIVFRARDVRLHADNGQCFEDSPGYSGDLFMAPEKKTVWMNVWPSHYSFYAHREQANLVAASRDTRIACVEVTYTEGQGL